MSKINYEINEKTGVDSITATSVGGQRYIVWTLASSNQNSVARDIFEDLKSRLQIDLRVPEPMEPFPTYPRKLPAELRQVPGDSQFKVNQSDRSLFDSKEIRPGQVLLRSSTFASGAEAAGYLVAISLLKEREQLVAQIKGLQEFIGDGESVEVPAPLPPRGEFIPGRRSELAQQFFTAWLSGPAGAEANSEDLRYSMKISFHLADDFLNQEVTK